MPGGATTASLGHQAKLATSVDSATPTTDAVTQPFEFISCTVKKTGTIIGGEGISGTRASHRARTRTGPYKVSGSLVMEPDPAELALWFPRILGAAASGTFFALSEVIKIFNLSVDQTAKVPTWRGCKVNKATFSSSGGMLRLSLDIEGLTEVMGNAGSFPSLTLNHAPGYIFEGDSVFTLGGYARETKDFELVIDNALDTERFMNNLTRVSLPEGPRTISLKTTHAWSSQNVDLYDQALAGSAGSLVLTNGNYSTTFSFGCLQVPPETPVVQGKGEIDLVLNMTARNDGTDSQLEVTHDSTP